MGKFLDLMKATESEWDKEVSADLPEGDYIFELKQHKKQEDRDALVIYFVAKKPVNGDSTFRADKYRPIPVQFNEKNTWIFVKFAKDSGIKLDKVEAQLPRLIGKLYSGTVKRSAGSTPNADGSTKYFSNINNLTPYNPNATAQNLTPVTDDESLD